MLDGAFSLSGRMALIIGIGAATGRFLAAIRMGRFAEPVEVAGDVGFIGTGAASYVRARYCSWTEDDHDA